MKKSQIVLVLLFLTASCSLCFSQSDPDPYTDMDVFLSQGISDGLLADNFPKKVAQKILDTNELWIGKCPICDNVRNGFHTYINNEDKKKKRHTKNKSKQSGTAAKQGLVEAIELEYDIMKQKKGLRSLLTLIYRLIFSFFRWMMINTKKCKHNLRKEEK